MKKITITNVFKVDTKVRHSELTDIIAEGMDENEDGTNYMDASDGYHTFKELYEHRIGLFIALCNAEYRGYGQGSYGIPWKSKLHHDGTMYDGWFIAGIGTEKGKQISYHLPMKDWDKLRVVTYDKAPEWDGHTPADVINRLLKL